MNKNVIIPIFLLLFFIVVTLNANAEITNYNLVKQEFINVSIGNSVSVEEMLYTGEDDIFVHIVEFSSEKAALEMLEENKYTGWQDNILEYNGHLIFYYGNYIEWFSDKYFLSISAKSIIEPNELVDYYLSVYPTKQISSLAVTNEKVSATRAISTLTNNDLTVLSTSCRCGLSNVCWTLPDDCYVHGSDCFYTPRNRACRDGSAYSLGDPDWCTFRSQVPHYSATGCVHNEYMCNEDGECLSGLNCMTDWTDYCPPGEECGCCYDNERWSEVTNGCISVYAEWTKNGNYINTALINDNVRYNIYTQNVPQGTTATVKIYETDPGSPDDLYDTKYVTINNNYGYFDWVVPWVNDPDDYIPGPSTYPDFVGQITLLGLTQNSNVIYTKLGHEDYDCELDNDCLDYTSGKTILCEEQGDVSMTDGCCYDYENWNDNTKDCNYAVYGTVYKVTTNQDGTFNEQPFSNLKILFKISQHSTTVPGIGPLIEAYDETYTDSNGNFYFNPEHADGVFEWNHVTLAYNWQVDGVYAVQGNEIIGEWSNNFNNGFWSYWGTGNGLDNGYRLGTKTRHQIVRIHTDMPLWAPDGRYNSASISKVSSTQQIMSNAPAIPFEDLITTKVESKSNELFQKSNIATVVEPNSDLVSVRITGTLNISKSGEYTFFAGLIGGIRLYIDGNEIINWWEENLSNTERNGTIYLGEGDHSLVLEYFKEIKSDYFYFNWITPDGVKENLPPRTFNRENIEFQYYKATYKTATMLTYNKLSTLASNNNYDYQQNYQISFLEDPKVYDSYRQYNPSKIPIIMVHGNHGVSGYWDYWEDLLNSAGYEVWQFYYPGDQENMYSAALLKDSLDYISHIYGSYTKYDIIAHSMGTLVTRGYVSGLAKTPSGIIVPYKNNVRNLVLLAGPYHGSYLANRVLKGEDVTNDPGDIDPDCEFLELLIGSQNPEEPGYSDLSIGSEFTWNLANSTFNPNINHLVITGTQQPPCVSFEADQSDGLVSLVSASLLNKNVSLVSVNENHGTVIGYQIFQWWNVNIQDIVNIALAFINGQPKSVIENYLGSGEYYIDPKIPSSNPYSEGAILLKINGNRTISNISIKNQLYSFDLKKDALSKAWFHYNYNDFAIDHGLTIPKGTYHIYIDNVDSGFDTEIKAAQTTIQSISLLGLDQDADGTPDINDACIAIYGTYFNGCTKPTCTTCKYSYCPSTGQPYCLNNASSSPCGVKDCDYLDSECKNYYDVNNYCSGYGSCVESTCNSYSNYLTSKQCGIDYFEYGCPWGTSAGADVGKRNHDYHCDGIGNCVDYTGSWGILNNCNTDTYCYWDGDGQESYNYYCYAIFYDRDDDTVSDSIDNCPDDYNPNQADCNANNVGDVCDTINPSATEDCNNIDDDCDGLTDESLTRSCSNACFSGIETCSLGNYGNCNSNPLPTGYGTSCSVGVGACQRSGSIGCNGICDVTVGAPSTEVCDNVDNDCDGSIDESLTQTCGSGNCQGTKTCSTGVWGSCSTNGNSCGTKDCDYLDTECTDYTDKSNYCNANGFCQISSCDSFSNKPLGTLCGDVNGSWEYGCPSGNNLGNDVEKRYSGNQCNGGGSCLDYTGNWQAYEQCSNEQYCYRDGSGSSAEDYYCKTVDFTLSFPVNNSVYGAKRIPLTVSSEKSMGKIEYSVNGGRYSTLASGKTSFSAIKSFKDGNNILLVRATYPTKIITKAINFIIDAKKPRISGVDTPERKYINGEFNVEYTEDNCKYLFLSINGINKFNTTCDSGKRIEKLINYNLSQYEKQTVDYTFSIIDIAGNKDDEAKKKLVVDTIKPEFERVEVTPIGRYVYFKVQLTEKVKSLKYSDSYTGNGREYSLCTNCEEYGISKEKRKRFAVGYHDLTLIAYDKAGNKATANVNFEIK